MQYGVLYPSFMCIVTQLTIFSGFVLLQMCLAHYWDWNKGSSMSNVAGMVRSLRISKLFHHDWPKTVPVVAIFTKFDDLITQIYDMNKEDEKNREVACATLENKFKKPLKGYKFPPCTYVQIECMCLLLYQLILGLIACPAINEDDGNHQEQIGELMKQTAVSIDNLALKMLFVTVQQNNLEICLGYAVNKFVIYMSVVASTYLLISDISFSILPHWYCFFLKDRNMTAQMNKEGHDLQGCNLVWTLLCSGVYVEQIFWSIDWSWEELCENLLLAELGKIVTSDISGCKYHDVNVSDEV